MLDALRMTIIPVLFSLIVEGRVLNGTEAEQGKGTIWCIVGIKQYAYCPPGYIEPLSTPTPAPSPAPTASPTATPGAG